MFFHTALVYPSISWVLPLSSLRSPPFWHEGPLDSTQLPEGCNHQKCLQLQVVENLAYNGFKEKSESRWQVTLTRQLNNVGASGLCDSVDHCFEWPRVMAPAPEITSIVKAGRWKAGSIQPCHPVS